jgi:hypothetical protein
MSYISEYESDGKANGQNEDEIDIVRTGVLHILMFACAPPSAMISAKCSE